MKKIGGTLLKCMIGILAIFMLWVIILNIFFRETVIFEFNTILIILGVIIYTVIITLIYKKLIPKIKDKEWIPKVLLILFAIIAVIVGYNLRLNPTWDMGEVFNLAKEYATTGNANSAYLYQYPNNIGMAGILIIVFKVFSIFNISDTISYITIATVMNAIIVTLSVVCLYYAVKKLFGKERALLVLIITLLTTPFYLYTAIYYTDTIAMFIVTFLLLLWTSIKYYDNKKNTKIDKIKKIILSILFGIAIIAGIKVKITSIFIIIAIILEELLSGNIKDFIKKFKLSIVVAIITLIICNIIINNYVLKDKETLDIDKMPLEYWILIGSINEGGFNGEENEYIMSFPTYKERKEKAQKRIIEVFNDYTPKEFIQHINKKLNYAWTDGTYCAPEKLRREPVKKTSIYEYVLANGENSYLYKYFPQSMHLSMLILVFISILKVLLRKYYSSKEMVLYITILGFMLFFLIWENRSRYILPVIPLMIILETKGIEIVSNIVGKVRKQIWEN